MPNVRYFFPVQKAKLANMPCDSSVDNLIYTRHMYYTDMAEMGAMALYFNMVSNIQIYHRFISRYNYYREVWEVTRDPLSKHSKFAADYISFTPFLIP